MVFGGNRVKLGSVQWGLHVRMYAILSHSIDGCYAGVVKSSRLDLVAIKLGEVAGVDGVKECKGTDE